MYLILKEHPKGLHILSGMNSVPIFPPSPKYSERTLVHKQPQDPWRSATSEHTAQWNEEVEYQLENYTNALLVQTIAKLQTAWEDTPS
jgi:hypothetical protein